MASRALRAGKAFIEMALEDRGVQKGLRQIERRLSSTGQSLKSVGGIGVAAGAAVTGAFAAAVNQFASTGDELDKMSARTGFSAQSLSELKFAAKQSGAEFKSLENGIRSMDKFVLNARRGLSSATDTLNELNLSVDDLEGKSPEQLFQLFADRIANVEDPTQRAALAMQVMGNNGQKLLPMLSLGSAGMGELRDEAKALGITLSDEAAADAAALTDALSRAWEQIMALVVAIGAALAPTLLELLSYTTTYLAAAIAWIKENQTLVIGLAAAAAALTTVSALVFAVGVGFSIASAAVGVFSAIIGAVASILASPVILIGGIVTALAALVDWFFFGGKGAEFLWSVIQNVFGNVAQFVIRKVQEVLGWLGDFTAELLGLDEQSGSVEGLNAELERTGQLTENLESARLPETPTQGQAVAAAQADAAAAVEREAAAAAERAAGLQAAAARSAASVAPDPAAVGQGASAEGPLTERIAVATERAAALLKQIERAGVGGATFA